MLSYISKTVTKAYKASKKALSTTSLAYKETPQYKLIRLLQKNQSQLLPSDKLSQLATLSYDSQKFYLILDILMLRMNPHPDPQQQIIDLTSSKGLKQLRNCFVICGYLVRNGASGYIDEFREGIQQVKALGRHLNGVFENECSGRSQKYKGILNQVINRIKHFIDLLQDNKKLLKQKQISMLIKQKLKSSQKQNKNTNLLGEDSQAATNNKKVDNFMNNYLWKYINIIDDKLDYVAQVLADKLQKYLVQEVPQNFEIDELEVNEEIRMKSEANFAEKQVKEETMYVQKKCGMKKIQDLLS